MLAYGVARGEKLHSVCKEDGVGGRGRERKRWGERDGERMRERENEREKEREGRAGLVSKGDS